MSAFWISRALRQPLHLITLSPCLNYAVGVSVCSSITPCLGCGPCWSGHWPMDHLPSSTLDLSYHHRPAGDRWAVSDPGAPHQTWCWLSFLAWLQTCLITTRFPEGLDLGRTWLPLLALPCSPCLGTRELGGGWWGPCSAGCGTPSAPTSPSLRHKLLFLSNLISTGTKHSRQKSLAVRFR